MFLHHKMQASDSRTFIPSLLKASEAIYIM